MLKNEANPTLGKRERARGHIIEKNSTVIGLLKARHDAQERCLARARRPQQRHEFPRLGGQRHACKRRMRGKSLVDALDAHGNRFVLRGFGHFSSVNAVAWRPVHRHGATRGRI